MFLVRLVKTVIRDVNQDDILRYAAAIAFFAMLTLAPVLVLMVTVLGFLGENTQQDFVQQVQAAVGPQAGQVVRTVIDNAQGKRGQATVSLFAGGVMILIAATALFVHLQVALNRVFHVRSHGHMLRIWIHRRLLSLMMLALLMAVFLASLVVSPLVARIAPNLRIANIIVSFLVYFVVFTMLLRYLPDVQAGWRDVAAGGFVAALLFHAGKYAFGLYLTLGSISSVYGAAGSLVVLLLWLFYSGTILLFGGEIAHAGAVCRGKPPVANRFAIHEDAPADKRHEGKP